MTKSGKQTRRLFWLSVIGLVAVIPLAGIARLSSPRTHRNIPVFDQQHINNRIVNTPTPIRADVATSATKPSDTPAPLPSPTLKNSFVFIPVVEKEGNPLSFQARLPLLIKSEILVPFKERTILVDISDQHVYAYDKGKLIFSFIASTGRNSLTRPGHYKILDKIPNAYSDPWGFWMPNWMGIYYAGYNLENGFHSLPVLSNGAKLWGKKIGSPITYGCVVLMPEDMKKLYRWAGVGTAVVIQR